MIAAFADWHSLPFALAAASTAPMSDATPDDDALVRAALANDQDAFAELVRRHKRRVFGTCSRFARDAHQLEDLCQEVFLRAWRKLGRFRGEAPFEHWLARLTTNVCYDFLRTERPHRERLSHGELPPEMHDTGADAAIAAGSAREILAWAMGKMTAAEQLILTRLEIEERPVREISAQTGWSESNVKVRAFRARARLKEILDRNHESP